MNYTKPDYYNEFTCIASECPDTCCANWQIAIDKKTLQKYKELNGPFANRMNNSVDWKNGVFEQYERRCTFLNEDKLCDIYIENGPDMMCKICKSYPRHVEEYQTNNDIFLSMSCPEVARIILSKENPVTFIETERKMKSPRKNNDEYISEELYVQLQTARNAMISILQNREHTIYLRMSLVLALSHDIQNRIANDNVQEITQVVTNYLQPKRQKYLLEKILSTVSLQSVKNQYTVSKHMLKAVMSLYPLTKKWERSLAETYDRLFKMNPERYAKKKCEFLLYMKNRKASLDYEVQYEQLMVYFLFHYYCGAVYDEQQYAKVKYAVLSTFLIEELLFALWLDNGFELMDQDIVDIAYQYSREIEHSDENYLKLEKSLIQKKVFSLKNILTSLAAEGILFLTN